ncbi:MAG: hypothetical protein WA110_10325 [Anaerolineaceae bacterium]
MTDQNNTSHPAESKTPQSSAANLSLGKTEPDQVTQPVQVKAATPGSLPQLDSIPATGVDNTSAAPFAEEPERSTPQTARMNEDTRPVMVSTQPAERSLAQASQPDSLRGETVDLPEWLITFASQDETFAPPNTFTEQTQKVTAVQPLIETGTETTKPQPVSEEAIFPVKVGDWAHEEELTEKTSDLVEGEMHSQSEETQENILRAAPSAMPAVPIPAVDDTPSAGNINEVFLTEFQQKLELGQYHEAADLIRQHVDDQVIRDFAIQSMRQHLNLQPASQPLWDLFAELNAKENQPKLAVQALETARQINMIHGESNGTLTGIG